MCFSAGIPNSYVTITEIYTVKKTKPEVNDIVHNFVGAKTSYQDCKNLPSILL